MDVLSDTAGKTDAQSGFLYKHLLTFAIDMHSAFSSFFCLRKKQLNNPQLTYGVLLSYFSCEEAALEVLWSLVTQTKSLINGYNFTGYVVPIFWRVSLKSVHYTVTQTKSLINGYN